MKVQEKGSVYKTSRLSYLHNYILVGLVFLIIILILPLPYFDIMRNPMHFIIFFGLLIMAAGLSEEPEWERVFRKYILTNNEIVKLDGLIRKKRFVLPIQSIADVKVSKGIVGRIFNFGNVEVVGFKTDLSMKGIRNPEELQRILQQKINMQRAGIYRRKIPQRE